MVFTEALRILISADTGGAVRGINAVAAATDKSLGKSQKTIDAWSRGLTTAGAGMIAFGAAGLLGLGKAAQASEEANLSVVKLENTLQNMPRLAGENSKQFIDLAAAIQDKTAADADAIVEAEALLGTFQLTADEIKKITPLVVDYSRKFGVDLPSAAVQVGKALDGNIGALKRVGISIDETAFAADRFGAVQQALRDQVGGFAEEEGKTFAGSLERLKNELGDVAEGVGTGAVDAFTSLFGVVDGGIDKIKDLSPATQEAIGKFATFGSVALIAAGGLSFTIGQLIKMKQNFDFARAAVADFAGSGGLGRLARVSLVVGGLIALREVLGSIREDIEDVSVSKLENELLSLGRSGEIAGEQLSRILGGEGPLAQGGFGDMDEFSKDAVQFKSDIDAIDEALAQLVARDPKAAAGAFEEVTRALEDQGLPADKIRESFNDYADAVASADTASQTAAGSVDELGGAMEGTAEDTEGAVSQLQAYSDHLQGLTDPIFAAMDALTGVRDAQLAEKDAVVAVMEAQAALNEARASGDPAAIAEAERGLADAQRELSDAQWKTVTSAAEADAALARLKDAVDRGDVSVDEFKSTLQTWVRQGFLTQDQANRAAASVGGLGRAADEADKKRVDIPVTVHTGDAHNTIRVIQQKINSLTGKTVTVSVVASYTASASNALQTFGGRQQHGGRVYPGKWYITGEAGPELFVPDAPGTIVPNHKAFGSMPAASSGGGWVGGGPVVHNHFHIAGSILAERDLVGVINRQLSRGAINKNGRSL